MEIKQYLKDQREIVEEQLKQVMPAAAGPFAEHMESMRYSLFVGGKRLRPILCLAGAEAVSPGIEPEVALPFACALECIHTYSLIHDDLPAMDDDDLRRGKPTNHTIYGEAAAILAGDGLLTYAFELLSRAGEEAALPAAARLAIIELIARGAGSTGMVGGQSLDMIYEGKQVDYETLKTIHRSKTGALITAAVLSGGMAAGASPEQEQALSSYGDNIGLAFQIVDDLLDVVSTTEELGKPAGSDEAAEKVTYPSLFGLDRSWSMAKEAVERAITALAGFDHHADPLRALATYIIERKN
ncbi:polyprenyl synthetase family protein [Desulfogranum mediterraneum]|uniref:polyprenyl synthetase family protein n=1 Tax=Desulfogranum mediterraneum TaxID=160661 RepID=UPI0003F717C2|nr:farnesyl diphosphate synthase [Desulfogranum mediterraneum]